MTRQPGITAVQRMDRETASMVGNVSDLYNMFRYGAAPRGLSQYAKKNRAERMAEGLASLYHTPPDQQVPWVKRYGYLLDQITDLTKWRWDYTYYDDATPQEQADYDAWEKDFRKKVGFHPRLAVDVSSEVVGGKARYTIRPYLREGHLVSGYQREGEEHEWMPKIEDIHKLPPILPWKDPPVPMGKPGNKPGGFTASGRKNTEMGDLGEAMTQELGFRSLLPGKRQNPLDVQYDHSVWGFELKTMTTNALRYKVGMHPKEVAAKNEWAKEHGLKAAMMMLIYDEATGTGHLYWREGIGNYRLQPGGDKQGWHYAGTVEK